jgi:hypothetical protein
MTRSSEKLYPDDARYTLPPGEPMLFGHPAFWCGFKHVGLVLVVVYALGL